MSNNYQYPIVLGSLAAGNQPLSDFDTDYDAAARMGTLQCSVVGTNSLTLTSLSNYPTMVGYGNNQKVGFIASNTSTTLVSMGYSGLSMLNAYLNDGATRVGSGVIVAGAYYEFTYNSTLNSSAGGWQLISTISTSSTIANNTVLSNISGGTATPSANNLATAGASQVLIGSFTASGSGSATITNIPAGFDQYVLRYTNAVPSSNGASLRLQLSENNGASYINSGYNWSEFNINFAGTGTASGGTNNSGFPLVGDIGSSSTAGTGVSGVATLYALGSSTSYKALSAEWMNLGTGGAGNRGMSGGIYVTDTNVVNAIQVLYSSGNIQTGNFTLYGVRNA